MAGNRNSGRRKSEKPFYQALMAELTGDVGQERLNLIAMKLIQAAQNGDMEAIKMLADRTDGRPVQQNVISGDEDAPLIPIINVRLRNE